MKRKEIEQQMKAKQLQNIGLVYNASDPWGVYCELRAGFLCDYTGHRVDRNKNIWGYVQFINGKPQKVSFEEMKDEILFC